MAEGIRIGAYGVRKPDCRVEQFARSSCRAEPAAILRPLTSTLGAARVMCRWLSPWLVVLAAASCGFPRLPELAGGGPDGGSDGGPLPVTLELLAGDIRGPGNVDGPGAAARFNFPQGVASDSAGNVYIADTSNSTIRKITPLGVVTTLAGRAGMSGTADGIAAAARFYGPCGVAVDDSGHVYVADSGNLTIRKITASEGVTTLAGTPGIFGSGTDGTGPAAHFDFPIGVALDSTGNLYVADTNNGTIRKVTPAGVVTTLAGTAGMRGSADGTGAAARFNVPEGVAVDSFGNVYVADTLNHTIRKITPTGVVTTVAGTAGMAGSTDASGAAARFNEPIGVAVDSIGYIYVADNGNRTIRRVAPDGVVTTLAGTAGVRGNADGIGAAARFGRPAGLAADAFGNIYVADGTSSTIRKITPAGVVTTLAGTATEFGSADGTGAAARFADPEGVTVDSADNVYVADRSNDTIRQITADGVVTTVAGTAGAFGSADGTGAAARFNAPTSVALDRAGTLYVTDGNNGTVRQITPAGGVTTLAGAPGMFGTADGPGAAARFDPPTDVAVDSAGNAYVADPQNHTIRKITPAGFVTTLAGMPRVAGIADGPGATAGFNGPGGVAVDSAGNVYVADTGNHSIRKITADGFVTTLAGTTGIAGTADGTGTAAQFNTPSSVAVDSTGNVYVADLGNATLRKITPAGATTTIAGTAGVAEIVLGATPRLAFPVHLAITGDSIVLSDDEAILLLRHAVR